MASAGLLSLALTLLAVPLGAGSRWDPRGTFTAIAAGAWSAVLFATVGGVAIAYVITPDIRQWVRLAIFVGFFSLLAVALLLDRLGACLRRRTGGRIAAGVLVCAVGVVALLDQTSSEFIPPYRRLTIHFTSDEAFVSAIEHQLPPRSAVLQLPYMTWPDPGFVNRMSSYAEARGYLHSDSLRWSYGAIRGRPADWEAQLVGEPPEVIAAAAAAAGFDGIYIDRFGYKTTATGRLEGALAQVLGSPPMVSSDDRLSFFDVRAYARRLRRALPAESLTAIRNATLYPARLDAGTGAETRPPRDFPTTGLGVHGSVHIRHVGELDARAPSGVERVEAFTARLSIAGLHDATTIMFPNGLSLRPVLGSRPVFVCRLMQIRGTLPIRFEVAGNETLHIDDARLTDEAYGPFLAQRQCGSERANGHHPQ